MNTIDTQKSSSMYQSLDPNKSPPHVEREPEDSLKDPYEYCTPIWLSIEKRIIDLIVSSCTLIIFLPVMILIAIIIRLDSPGPAIFRQTRIGQNRRYKHWRRKNGGERRREDLHGYPFTFYKFRTMYVDARQRWPDLYKYEYTPEEIETMRFKLMEDPRLTRAGDFLRRHTLDELPNFFNVLIGNMTLIGPRPDIPEMMKYYKPWQLQKFKVKPGVTGMAQCDGRGLLTFQETIDYDVMYVNKKNFSLDFYIFWKTTAVVLKSLGAF